MRRGDAQPISRKATAKDHWRKFKPEKRRCATQGVRARTTLKKSADAAL